MLRSPHTARLALALAGLPAFPAAVAVADEPLGYFPEFLITAPETVNDPLVVLGAPDDRYFGLGEDIVIYTLGAWRVVDLPGPDLNVYEADFGAVEFNLMDILVSNDRREWVSLKPTMAPAVRLVGDERHNSATHRRSFDLAGSGLSEARFIMIRGLGTGPASGTNGFDLDAVGLIHWTVPGPASLAALAGLITLRRRR
ncbi:MAG: hypothetical protein KF912_10905 [Phycisphaeraceae bacterium]|nr:hypothetical protein [Phycisphaeraceae bacterium]MBX3367809.1 hypothetical protein [Phycisphaeraceae bacterium]